MIERGYEHIQKTSDTAFVRNIIKIQYENYTACSTNKSPTHYSFQFHFVDAMWISDGSIHSNPFTNHQSINQPIKRKWFWEVHFLSDHVNSLNNGEEGQQHHHNAEPQTNSKSGKDGLGGRRKGSHWSSSNGTWFWMVNTPSIRHLPIREGRDLEEQFRVLWVADPPAAFAINEEIAPRNLHSSNSMTLHSPPTPRCIREAPIHIQEEYILADWSTSV